MNDKTIILDDIDLFVFDFEVMKSFSYVSSVECSLLRLLVSLSKSIKNSLSSKCWDKIEVSENLLKSAETLDDRRLELAAGDEDEALVELQQK